MGDALHEQVDRLLRDDLLIRIDRGQGGGMQKQARLSVIEAQYKQILDQAVADAHVQKTARFADMSASGCIWSGRC